MEFTWRIFVVFSLFSINSCDSRGAVDYDWDDPDSYGYGWIPFVQGDKGYYYGNVTCIPDKRDGGVMGDYGNCHDAEIGGKNSLWKSCVHVFLPTGENGTVMPGQNETDWRCTCHFTMNPKGMDCDVEDYQGASFMNAGIWFLSVALVYMVDSVLAVRLCISMLRLKGWKLNAAITSNILVTGGLISEFFRHTLYVARNEPVGSPIAMNAVQFDIGLFLLPITIICFCQALLGLSITWIGIAEKTGNIKGAKRKLVILRTSLYVYMVSITLICLFFAANNDSVLMSYVGLLSWFLIIPALYFASKRLRKLLANGAPPKPGQFDMADCLKKTTRRLMVVTPLFFSSLVWFLGVNTAINQVGVTARDDSPIFSLCGVGLSLWYGMHAIKNFFNESNAAAIAKFNTNRKVVSTMYGKDSSGATSSEASSSSTSSVAPSSVEPSTE